MYRLTWKNKRKKVVLRMKYLRMKYLKIFKIMKFDMIKNGWRKKKGTNAWKKFHILSFTSYNWRARIKRVKSHSPKVQSPLSKCHYPKQRGQSTEWNSMIISQDTTIRSKVERSTSNINFGDVLFFRLNIFLVCLSSVTNFRKYTWRVGICVEGRVY